jgi:hypothetical protein
MLCDWVERIFYLYYSGKDSNELLVITKDLTSYILSLLKILVVGYSKKWKI